MFFNVNAFIQLRDIFLFFLVVKYTPDQIMKMEESIRIRREAEPVELVKLVRLIQLLVIDLYSVELSGICIV